MTPDMLPDSIGLFDAEDTLLLPSGHRPLGVTGPRNCSLIDDALASRHRLVGIFQHGLQTNDGAPGDIVGCAGRIISFNEVNQDQYAVILSGVCRFRANEGPSPKGKRGYRSVRPVWSDYLGDLAPIEASGHKIDRNKIRHLFRGYLDNIGVGAEHLEWEAFQGTSDNELIASLAMACPFSNLEKLELLEAKDSGKLAEKLMAFWGTLDPGAGKAQTLH